MLAFLDVRTLVFVDGITGIIAFLSMLYIMRTRKTYPGFLQWTIATFLFFIGQVLLSMRGDVSDVLSILTSNTLIVAATLLLCYGLSMFVGKKPNRYAYAATFILFIAIFSFFSYSLHSIAGRIVISAVLLSICFFYCSFLTYRYVPKLLRSPNWLLTIGFSLLALGFLRRSIVTLIFRNRIEEFLTTSTTQEVTFIAVLAGGLIMAFGLIILNSQRLENELRTAVDEVRTLRGIIPICASCKKIRDDKGSWKQIEAYVSEHSEADFSHGICPECAEKLYPEFVASKKNK
jgi:hypothetical protein